MKNNKNHCDPVIYFTYQIYKHHRSYNSLTKLSTK
jgi:hypothetical protein